MANLFTTAFYRAKQFFTALNATVSEADLEQVQLVFKDNEQALTLFKQMSPSDQYHAIAVLKTLQTQGQTHLALQQAALLHDVAKSLGQPLIHRVLIVLLEAFWPSALRGLANTSLNTAWWRRPFVVHQQHPEIGAIWAEAAGCDGLVVDLIRGHQEKPVDEAVSLFEELHKRLYETDGLN